MESIHRATTMADGTGGKFPDGSVSSLEPRPLQVQSPACLEEEYEAGNDPIRVRRLQIQALHRKRSDLQQAIASARADLQQAVAPRFDSDIEALEVLKNDLKVDLMHFEEGIMNLLRKKNQRPPTNSAEKTKISLKEKENAVDLIFKGLKKLLKKKEKFAGEEKSLISSEEKHLLLGENYVKQQAILRKIDKLAMEMRKRWVEIDELLPDYKEMMEKILWEGKNDLNGILRYIVVATILALFALQFLQATVGRIAKD